MCKVKSGELLENMQDMQNLVIGIINRQDKSYNRESIVNTVCSYSKGCKLEINKTGIEHLVDDNLSYLYRKGFIDCNNGQYTPQPILELDFI